MKKQFTLILLLFNLLAFSQCWQSISAGDEHVLAVQANGDLYGWGSGTYGKLGGGDLVDKPTLIQSAGNFQVISSGVTHSLAIKTNGTLWASGSNLSGCLGIGNSIQQNTFIQVGTDTNWKSVSAGTNYSLAIKTDGTLWACGWNNYGQLGFNTSCKYDPQPYCDIFVQVGTSTDWKKISAGGQTSGAIKTDGTLWTWGSNWPGQIGDGTVSPPEVYGKPVTQIGSDTNWESISRSGHHFVAIKTDGTLWSWGGNSNGELGDGTFVNKSIPSQVGTDNDWQFVETGSSTTLALKKDGSLWVCGLRVGDGTKIYRNTLVNINPGTTQAISGGDGFCTAIKSGGGIWAWGWTPYSYVLGNGLEDILIPRALYNYCSLPINEFEKNNFSLYPNPTSKFININNSKDLAIEKITVSDISGKVIFATNQNLKEIDLQQYAPGIYFVHLESNGENFFSKIIKI